MFAKSQPRTRWTVALLATTLAAGSFLTSARPAAAGPLDDAAGSLALVPEDAVFYSACLRGREQIDAVLESNAWARIKTMPVVQLGMMMAALQASQPDSPLKQVQDFLKQEENQELVELLKDLGSEEMFVYGNADWLKLLDLLTELQAANQFGPLFQALEGVEGADLNQARQEMILQALVDNLDAMVIPDTVFGFKVSQKEAAATQLARLQEIVALLLEREPALRERFTRTKVGPGEFLTLKLDGSMIPWDEIDRDEADIPEELLDKLIEHVSKQTFVVSLGVLGDYALLSFGDSTDHLASLGSGRTLRDKAELQKLLPHAGKRLTSINYVSKTLMQMVGTSEEDLDGFKALAVQLLPQAELDPDLEKRILDDVDEMLAEMKGYIPKPGAMLGFAFMTDRGTENYTYNWTKNAALDATKPLTLMNHVGGAPLIAAVTRAAYQPESYDLCVKYARKFHGYFEEIALPRLDPEPREMYERAWPRIEPLLARASEVTRTMLIPSLKDGQTGIVIDSKLTSRQWHEELPPTALPMPIIEPALVFGVSDRALLVQAMEEYRKIVNDTITTLEEISEGEFTTDFKLAAPEERKFEQGSVYYYVLPPDAGFDKRLAPNAGLSDDVLVFTIAPRHSVRLLKETPIDSDGPLARIYEQPLAGALFVDTAGLIDMLTPWIDLGVRAGTSQFGRRLPLGAVIDEDDLPPGGLGDPADDSPMVRQILDQVHTALNVLKVFRSYSSITYEEGETTITHGEWRIVDLP